MLLSWHVQNFDVIGLICYNQHYKISLNFEFWDRHQTIIGSDNGLSPDQHQAIIWANAGTLLTGPLGMNLSEISIKLQKFSYKEMDLKMPSAKWQPILSQRQCVKRTFEILMYHEVISQYLFSE